MGDSIFSGLAHLIKGSVFFWFGIMSLGRWAGSWSNMGWVSSLSVFICHVLNNDAGLEYQAFQQEKPTHGGICRKLFGLHLRHHECFSGTPKRLGL